MTKTLLLSFTVGILSPLYITAQEPLSQIFRFVNLPASARISALGGYALGFTDKDVSLAIMNPASLSGTLQHQISFQSSKRFGDTKGGDFTYANTFNTIKTTLWGGVHYMDYGSFTGLDAIGNKTEGFTAKENAFLIGATRQLHAHYSLGVALKYISSSFEQYQSTGLLGDVGVMYHAPDHTTNASLLIKNIGIQTSTYTGTSEDLPFEILAGLSRRLKHLPFIYGLTYRYLNRWNLLYYNPQEETGSIFSNPSNDQNNTLLFVDNLARHLVFSGEFLLGKRENFRLRIGYNHMRRKDLAPKEYFNLTGVSFGFGFKVYHVRLDYGYAKYHQGGNVHHFGISTDLSEFYTSKKKEVHTGSIGAKE